MTPTQPSPPASRATPAELARVVFRLRRALAQAAGGGIGAELPFAKVEALRLVHQRPGLRVQDVAEALGIAPNTASGLVKQLIGLGFVDRRQDRGDARVARLYPTDLALARKATRHSRRDAAVGAALDSLGGADRELIESAVPALQRLLEALGDGRPAAH